MSELPDSNLSTPNEAITDDYQVTPEGSLGLLAFGHIGLKLWREKRKEVHQARVATSQKLQQDKIESIE